MADEVRLTGPTLLVLKTFLADLRRSLAGAEIMQQTDLRSGTLYPILLRLERHSILTSDWEEASPEALGRPRRRFYSMTPTGAAFARQALASLALPPRKLSAARVTPEFA